MKDFLDFRDSNINPTYEQIKFAKKQFMELSQPYFDKLHYLAIHYCSPVLIIRLDDTCEYSITHSQKYKEVEKYLLGCIEETQVKIHENILKY